ncbi:TAXI family TRAP transporter solute-binding subunit [Thermocoleostomius sinensis]|uniref:TAXI family TRAP transporter solute-binding subunit n=1 Tax=Thermocoleostomius sinensis A174 TaxID=2016057 RepID=A0A9E8ZGF1_9CYAN|nr:TAXI family TRAP transporter solute-binding subunit [Thermocoleostomius sinensis]WAL60750.1 TAXI family TRAP transporter solute-binding subunit [Thermocoleostomius sinensis A174]
MVRARFVFPVVLLSIVAATGLAVQWWREQHQVYRLVIATGGAQGEYYAFGQALATVVAQHHPDIAINVLETEGSQQNIELLQQGQAQLAIIQSDTPPQPSARALAFLFPEVFHLIARSDANIRSFGDLRGKRVALMPEGSGSYKLFWALSQHYYLTAADFTALPMSPDAAYAALRQGEVDALSRVMALGNPALAELLRTSQSQLVPIDQVEALRLSLPYLEATQIPKGTYDGAVPIPAEDLPVVSVRAVLISHAELDPKLTRAITQTLFEFRNELVVLHPRTATIRLPEAGENLGLPLHPGAKAYYEQDRPVFWVEYAEPIGLLFSVGVLAASGLWQLRLWLDGRQKNRADRYNLEIVALMEQIQTANDLTELETIRYQLFEILRQVVVDLDKDRISPESFQSFTFPWETAITTLRHREMLLMNARSQPPVSPDLSSN